MVKILVAMTFGLLGATLVSGCVVRTGGPVVMRPAPPVVVQPVVVQEYKYKHKGKGKGTVIVID